MATMNVSLPDEMKAWVEERVREGRFANASDYVRHLIREHQTYEEKMALLRAEIQKGLDSGVSDRTFEEIRADAKRKAKARARGVG